MTVLADSSIWVEHFRGGTSGRAARLDDLLAAQQVVMFGIVASELVAGARPPDRASLWRLLSGLPWLDLDRDAWRRAGEVSADLRRRGAATPLTDIAIAVAAATGGAEIWTDDVHFDRIGEVLPQLRRFTP